MLFYLPTSTVQKQEGNLWNQNNGSKKGCGGKCAQPLEFIPAVFWEEKPNAWFRRQGFPNWKSADSRSKRRGQGYKSSGMGPLGINGEILRDHMFLCNLFTRDFPLKEPVLVSVEDKVADCTDCCSQPCWQLVCSLCGLDSWQLCP